MRRLEGSLADVLGMVEASSRREVDGRGGFADRSHERVGFGGEIGGECWEIKGGLGVVHLRKEDLNIIGFESW